MSVIQFVSHDRSFSTRTGLDHLGERLTFARESYLYTHFCSVVQPITSIKFLTISCSSPLDGNASVSHEFRQRASITSEGWFWP